MKLNKVLTVSASVLAVAALTATQAKAAGTNNTASGNHVEAIAAAPNVSSVTIKAQSGDAARLYIVPDEQYPSTLYVGNGSTHAVLSTQVKGNVIWFEIGENEWVKATDTTYAPAASKIGSSSSTSSNANTGIKTNNGSNTGKTQLPSSQDAVVTSVPNGTVAKITNSKGAILYSDPVKETKTNRTLPAGSSWKVTGQYGHGVRWYRVGTNQWIKVADTNAPVSGSSKTGSTAGKSSSNNDQHSDWETFYGSGQVTIASQNKKGAVVYSNPDLGTKTKRFLPNGTSWKVFLIRHNFWLWYNLGGNQWVWALDTDPNTSTAQISNPSNNNSSSTTNSSVKMTDERGVARVTYRTPIVVWGQPGAKPLGKYLKPGTSWKYFGKTTINGETWYNLGGNQWLPLRYLYVSGAQPTQSQIDKELAQRTSGTVVVAYATPIVVWGQPGAKPTKKYLRNKTAWHFFKKTEVNGTTWYNLGGNQWVPSTYVYVRFRN